MDEDALMRQVQTGDTRAFACLVKAYQPRVLRFTGRMLGHHEAAQDAAQETFLRLWRLRDRYRPQGNFGGYLLRIARNVCLDSVRANRADVSLEEELAAGTGEECLQRRTQERRFAEAARLAILSLPEPQRVVFALSHYEGLSYREIAELLDCPLGTVASRKAQAVDALRRRLSAWNIPD